MKVSFYLIFKTEKNKKTQARAFKEESQGMAKFIQIEKPGTGMTSTISLQHPRSFDLDFCALRV